MSNIKNLPIVKTKKKIDLKKFVELAKKVKESFEQEKEYLENKANRDENSNSTRFLPNI